MVAAKICFPVKDTHREKTRSNETLTNNMNMDIWVVATLNQLYMRFFNLNKVFKKSSYWAKLLSLWEVHSALPISFVLTLASDGAVLYQNITFSIFALVTKKTLLLLFENDFWFPENLFQS